MVCSIIVPSQRGRQFLLPSQRGGRRVSLAPPRDRTCSLLSQLGRGRKVTLHSGNGENVTALTRRGIPRFSLFEKEVVNLEGFLFLTTPCLTHCTIFTSMACSTTPLTGHNLPKTLFLRPQYPPAYTLPI